MPASLAAFVSVDQICLNEPTILLWRELAEPEATGVDTHPNQAILDETVHEAPHSHTVAGAITFCDFECLQLQWQHTRTYTNQSSVHLLRDSTPTTHIQDG